MHVVVRVAPLAMAALTGVMLASCAPPGPPAPTPSSLPTGTTSAPPPLSIPANYEQVCNLEASVCSNNGEFGPYGTFPSDFARPVRLPSLTAGQPCPVSSGEMVVTKGFGGMALGSGPTRPLVVRGPDSVHPGQNVPFTPWVSGWYSVKTLWFVDPSYQGAVLVRGARVDGPGAMAVGEAPDLGELIIPPGPTLNQSSDGYREAPGGTYVKVSGCYAWQVDGIGFSTVIVFSPSCFRLAESVPSFRVLR